eukprot:scaffold123670_cov75-Phaeocystis_antarctica.AAC.3
MECIGSACGGSACGLPCASALACASSCTTALVCAGCGCGCWATGCGRCRMLLERMASIGVGQPAVRAAAGSAWQRAPRKASAAQGERRARPRKFACLIRPVLPPVGRKVLAPSSFLPLSLLFPPSQAQLRSLCTSFRQRSAKRSARSAKRSARSTAQEM